MTIAASPAPLEADRTASEAPRDRLSLGALSWSLFEGARNPYVMLITIYIFMPYVAQVLVGNPVRGQEIISRFSQYSGWAVMLSAPLLGASIDNLGRRKLWMAITVALMIPLTASLWFAKADHSGLSLMVVLTITAIVGTLFTWTEVLHNSLLVRAAGLAGAHKASGLAVGLGQAFSLAALAFTAWAFALPGLPSTRSWGWLPAAPLFNLSRATHEPERVVTLLTAGIFAVGALPFFFFTPDAPRSGVPIGRAFLGGARDMWAMVKTVKHHRDAAIFLLARMFYVDGMTAVLIYAGIYAAGVMKWGPLQMLVYGISLCLLGVLGGFSGRWLDAAAGPKRAVQIQIAVAILGIVAMLGMAPDKILYFWHWDPALHAPLWNGPFFRTVPELIFVLIGFFNSVFIVAQYSSSRTLLTRLSPESQSGAFFGVYALSGTATIWLGPTLVNAGTHLFKTQQGGFATIILLLAVGLVGLTLVKGGGRAVSSRAI